MREGKQERRERERKVCGFSLCLSLSDTACLSFSLTHTHTHTHTLSLSLSPRYRHSRLPSLSPPPFPRCVSSYKLKSLIDWTASSISSYLDSGSRSKKSSNQSFSLGTGEERWVRREMSEGEERGGKRMEEESKDVKKSEEEQEPPTLCVQCLHYPVCVCV